MSALEQQIREILNRQRYPVNPDHEAAFREMLLGRKRKRRPIVFFLVLAGLGIATALFLTSPDRPDDRKSSLPAAHVVSGTESDDSRAAISHPLDATPVSDEQPAAQTQDKLAQTPQATAVPGSNSRYLAPDGQNGIGSPAREVINHQSVTSATHLPINNQQQADEMAPGKVLPQQSPKDRDQESDLPAPHAESPSLPDQKTNMPEATGEHAVETEQASPESTTAIILPATRQIPGKRLAYGVSGAWYLGGIGQSGVSTGHGARLGGYVTYRMTPVVFLRSDIGFGILDGGFEFVKESETEVYRFSLITLTDRMRAEQLYMGNLTIEAGWITGRCQLYAGLQGQYLYGMKGDITHEEIIQDAPGPREVVSNDVWVTVADVERFALQGLAGIRVSLIPRLDIGAALQFPLIRQFRLAPDARPYEYTFKSPGVSPSLTLSYQISQQ